ncbi:hypothetical protein CRENBAI_006834, partial [Crenichthys baileyi]
MRQLGNWAGRPRLSTTRQPPQCRYKMCSTAPHTRPRPQPSTRPGPRAIAPHLNAGGTRPSIPAHTPTLHTPPHQKGRPASPCTKASPNPPLMDRAPKPGSEIRKNINNPERAETPAPASIDPKDPTPNHSTDTNQKTCSFSRLPTPDGKQRTGVWKENIKLFYQAPRFISEHAVEESRVPLRNGVQMDRSLKRRQVKPLAASLLDALDYDSSDDSDFEVENASGSDGTGNGSDEEGSKASAGASESDSENAVSGIDGIDEESKDLAVDDNLTEDEEKLKQPLSSDSHTKDIPSATPSKSRRKRKKTSETEGTAAGEPESTSTSGGGLVNVEESLTEPKKWNFRRNRPLLDFTTMEELNEMDDYDSEDDNDWRPTAEKKKGKTSTQKGGTEEEDGASISEDDDDDDEDDNDDDDDDEDDEGKDDGDDTNNSSSDSDKELKKPKKKVKSNNAFDDELTNDSMSQGKGNEDASLDRSQTWNTQHILICCVCLGDNSEDADEIIQCDNCGVTVHEGLMVPAKPVDETVTKTLVEWAKWSWPKTGLRGQQTKTPRLLSPQTPPPAPLGATQEFLRSAERYLFSVSWAIPWASSRWDVPGIPPVESIQEPPQLTPLDMEGQQLYSRLQPDGQAPHTISKGVRGHLAEEAYFGLSQCLDTITLFQKKTETDMKREGRPG